MISSEQLPLASYVDHYYQIQNDEYIILEKDSNGQVIYPEKCLKNQQLIQMDRPETTCAPYRHWMLKEIHEQSICLEKTMNLSSRLKNDQIILVEFEQIKEWLLSCQHIMLLGCGTSLHAGQIGSHIMRQLNCWKTVTWCDASEFTTDDLPRGELTCCLLLSQSGETKESSPMS